MTEPPRPPGDGTAASPEPTYQPPPAAPYAQPPPYAPPPPADYGPPGGYPPPGPPGGYPPAGPPGYPPAAPPGYGGPPPGYGAPPPPGYPTDDDKTWALIAHFGGALFGWLAGLVALLAKGQQSPTVRAHAVAALNFQILCAAVIVPCWMLGVCGALWRVSSIFWLGAFAGWAFQAVFSVLAGIKANEGQLPKYPISLSLVK